MGQGRGLIRPLGVARGAGPASFLGMEKPYGRLLRVAGVVGGRMDLFRTIARRLSLSWAFAALLLCAFSMVPSRAEAATPTFASAWSSCMAQAATFNGGQNLGYHCGDLGQNPTLHTCFVGMFPKTGSYIQSWQYDCSGAPNTSNPCAGLPSQTVNISYSGQQTLGTSGATWQTDYATGAQVQCPFTITYSNYSALADSQGNFHVQATMTYNGNPSGAESSTPTAGTSAYNDASGNPLAPQPTSDGSSSPQLCGGTSCADPSTGNVCSMVGGAQQCTKFPPWTPNMTGGCSGSSGAVCAGSPTAPIPAKGQGGVVDPATQIAGSDKYTSQNMQTGQVSTVVVNTYVGTPGQSVTNGATSTSKPAANSSGSSKPASSSTAAGNSGYGSGADCNSPPVCSGDAVMCGIGRQEWYAMCSAKASSDTLDKHLAGDGNGPPTFGSDSTKYGQGDVWSTPDTSQDGTVGGQANKGVYDQSGFGWGRACPIKDIPISLGTLGSFNVPASNGCIVGQWLSALIVGFALFSAAMITAGGRG